VSDVGGATHSQKDGVEVVEAFQFMKSTRISLTESKKSATWATHFANVPLVVIKHCILQTSFRAWPSPWIQVHSHLDPWRTWWTARGKVCRNWIGNHANMDQVDSKVKNHKCHTADRNYNSQPFTRLLRWTYLELQLLSSSGPQLELAAHLECILSY
jgi:hypothetical protein